MKLPTHTKVFKIIRICLSLMLVSGIYSDITYPQTITDNNSFIEKLERDSLKFFLEQTPEKTGLTKDSSRSGSPCSIAAIGFYLANIIVAVDNDWINRSNAFRRIQTVFTTLEKKAAHKNGFYYHFIDPKTGKRVWGSEASSIDTALLMAGVLLAGEYYKGTQVEKRAHKLYNRVQWDWMTNSTNMISHGWKPEKGFLPHYWDSYSELIILQALAIGSPTHPVNPEIWNNWNRFEEKVNGNQIVYCSTGSLFTYQYSHAFIDFRKLNDKGINYFENSALASQANAEFCNNFSNDYKTYQNTWGLTACLGPEGYKAYGASPGNQWLFCSNIL